MSRDGVLEWPSELWLKEDPDCLESRPSAAVVLCSVILNEGVEECRVVGGLRCWKLPEAFKSGRCAP